VSKATQLQSPSPSPAPQGKAALDTLLALVADDLGAVNRTIIDRMQSPVALIPQVANHLVAAGGKRLRPLLTLASARLCGYQGDQHVKLATCVEFIHTATLLHDDVVDESDLRRGKSSANAVWGNQTPVLVGDFLFSRSFELMVEVGHLPVLAILSRASSVIAEGEVLQLITTNDTATDESAYLQVIQGKTAELFAAACKVGAEIAGRPTTESQALYDYGNALGIAFQLVDDYLDYSANEAELGKTVGDDFREGKITLPIILALAAAKEQGLEDESAFWLRTMEKLEQTDSDLAHAMGLMQKHGTLEATRDRARGYGEQAIAALQHFPDNAYRQALAGIVEFCIERAY
jgi:octaprenyl-diphosphate synthase